MKPLAMVAGLFIVCAFGTMAFRSWLLHKPIPNCTHNMSMSYAVDETPVKVKKGVWM
jgi:hypothetical protein